VIEKVKCVFVAHVRKACATGFMASLGVSCLKSVGEVILGGRPLWFSLEGSIVRHSMYAMSHGGCDASSSPDASNLYR
jgi:hypothetical protein